MVEKTVRLFDSSNIDEFTWPMSEDGKKGRQYLYPLIKEGVDPYLHNVSTKMFLVTCNDVFIPFTLNDKEYDNSYIASNYYVLKFYEEYLAKHHPFWLKVQKPLLFLGGKCLKLCKINKTLFLNNWLMTNSLTPKIGHEELTAIIDFLTVKFCTHTIIFRHIDLKLKNDIFNSLKKNKFHLLKTRDIFFYHPEEKVSHTYNMRKLCRKDWKILKKYNYEIIRSDKIEESDYPRILALYKMLYLEKYTRYSPDYSEKFVKHTHQRQAVEYVLLKRDGVIEGFFSYFTFNKAMMNCLFGFDLTLPHSHEIYKLLTRLVLEEAEKLELVINDGSGGDVAKIIRGLKPSAEYMGLYNAHLPLPRRLLWNTVAFFYKILAPSNKEPAPDPSTIEAAWSNG